MIIIPEDVLRIAEALSASIEELGLSARSYNGLRRWGITTVADVYRAYEDKQLPRIRNLGEKSVIEIEKHLEEHLAKVAPANNSEIPNSSDTISRQQATDTLRGYLVGKRCPDDGTLTCRLIENEVINKLPPAQPEPSQLGTNLAEVGTDCISRQAVLDALNNIEIPRNASWYQYYQQALTAVDKLPPAQSEIVPCDYAKACNKVAMNRITSAVVYMEILEDFKEYGYVLVDMREVTG